MPESITNSPSSLKRNIPRPWLSRLIIFVRQNIRRPWLFWPIFILVCMFISFCLDRPILQLVRWANIDGLSGDYRRTLESFKEFGQGLAIVVAFLLIFTLDKSRRRMLPRLLLCIILPVFVFAWPTTLVVQRLRPRHADEYSTTLGLGFFTGSQPSPPFWARSLPDQDKIAFDGQLSYSEKHSFPSRHTATAFAFAFGLAALYPPARWLFYALAVSCGAHRVLFDAHWFSDVVASVFIGVLVARFVGIPVARFIETLFRRLFSSSPTLE